MFKSFVLRGDDGTDELVAPIDTINQIQLLCPHCGHGLKLSLTSASPAFLQAAYAALSDWRHRTPPWLSRLFS